jgi:Fe-S cluster assembly ATP-binding protein
MLKIKNISATSDNEPLLKDINLEVKSKEIHAILGPKNSGKSAIVHTIMGHPGIDLTGGDIVFNRKKIQKLDTNLRSKAGIFASFQHPPEFESITNWELIKEFFGVSEETSEDLKLKYDSCCELLDLGAEHGDKLPCGASMIMSQAKRNELIWMILNNPKLVILDEIDEGLTDNEVVLVGTILKEYLKEQERGCIVITHSQALLDIINPTHVHVMVGGEIKLSGETDLYKRIIEDGYTEFSQSTKG